MKRSKNTTIHKKIEQHDRILTGVHARVVQENLRESKENHFRAGFEASTLQRAIRIWCVRCTEREDPDTSTSPDRLDEGPMLTTTREMGKLKTF